MWRVRCEIAGMGFDNALSDEGFDVRLGVAQIAEQANRMRTQRGRPLPNRQSLAIQADRKQRGAGLDGLAHAVRIGGHRDGGQPTGGEQMRIVEQLFRAGDRRIRQADPLEPLRKRRR